MKKVFIALVFIWTALTLWAQSDSIPAEGGFLRLKERTVDVGSVSGDSIVNAQFTVYNDGTESVSILKIFSGCSCAVADYKKDPIEPGDSTTFKVRYDPRSYKWGKFRRTFDIRSTAVNSHLSAFLTGSIRRKYKK